MTDLDVLCVGSAALDTICVVDEHPAADDRVLTDSFHTSGGGPAATAAVAMARLGVRVGFCGVVGDDEAADQVLAGLQNEGVDTRWAVRDPAVQTPRSFIIAARTSGTRAIVTTGAVTPPPHMVPRSVAPLIHVDQSGFGAVAPIISGSGMRLSLDGGNPVSGLSMKNVWLYSPSVSALLQEFPAPNAHAAAELARREGASIVVATDGSAGSFWQDSRSTIALPGFRVPVASTLGAGDVFHGALVAALVKDMSPQDALVWANAAAALSCAAIDGRSAIPSTQELEQFLRNKTTQEFTEAQAQQ